MKIEIILDFITALFVLLVVVVTFDIDYPNTTKTVKKEPSNRGVLIKVTPLEEKEKTLVIEEIRDSSSSLQTEYKMLEKEWFPFRGVPYDYKPVKYDSTSLIKFVNILYRESGTKPSKYTLEDLNEAMDIDRYLVAITAVRGIQSSVESMKKINSLDDLLKSKTFFPYKKSSKVIDNEQWRDCYKVAVEVLNCRIPDFVPYIPSGTICYWNSRIDTNKKQKRYLENMCIHVGSSVKDHHYFAPDALITAEEKEFLIRNSTCYDRQGKGNKRIKAGILCDSKI